MIFGHIPFWLHSVKLILYYHTKSVNQWGEYQHCQGCYVQNMGVAKQCSGGFINHVIPSNYKLSPKEVQHSIIDHNDMYQYKNMIFWPLSMLATSCETGVIHSIIHSTASLVGLNISHNASCLVSHNLSWLVLGC